MEKTFEINVISARDIKNVNLISKMDVYAVVSVAGGDNSYYSNKQLKVKTPVDRAGGTNPTWNYPMKFTVQEAVAYQNRLTVVFKLRCVAALGDKDIGEVNVPVKELLDDYNGTSISTGGKEGEVNGGGDQGRAMRFVSYQFEFYNMAPKLQVRKPSGKPKGELNFSYRFTDNFAAAAVPQNKNDQPVTAYLSPVAGPSAPPYPYEIHQPPPPLAGYNSFNYGYPPPPPQAYPGGYPPPPTAPVYGYPPAPYGYPPAGGYGYGYPPPPVQQPPPRKSNNLGMGLGAGLLGGVLGGLLIGDLVSDGFGYDAGFGGF